MTPLKYHLQPLNMGEVLMLLSSLRLSRAELNGKPDRPERFEELIALHPETYRELMFKLAELARQVVLDNPAYRDAWTAAIDEWARELGLDDPA